MGGRVLVCAASECTVAVERGGAAADRGGGGVLVVDTGFSLSSWALSR